MKFDKIYIQAKKMTNTCTEFRKEMHKSYVLPAMQAAPSYSVTTLQNQNGSSTAMRPRSLYTAHNYHPQPEDPSFQVKSSLELCPSSPIFLYLLSTECLRMFRAMKLLDTEFQRKINLKNFNHI